MRRSLQLSALICALLAVCACAGGPVAPAAAASRPAPAPAEVFFAQLRALCGQAFAGRLVSSDPQDADVAGQAMVMHVRGCTEPDRLRIPFHIGDNRSRTWVLTRTGAGLELEHDHRHPDGTPEDTTLYGGDTVAAGTPDRQDFPADAYSRALFERIGRPASGTNVWSLAITADRRFVYQVARANRLFRAEFDLTRPVAPPPPPWGAAD